MIQSLELTYMNFKIIVTNILKNNGMRKEDNFTANEKTIKIMKQKSFQIMHLTADQTNIKRINKLEDRLVENIQIEAKGGREDALKTKGDKQDTVKGPNLCVIGVRKRSETEWERSFFKRP